MWRAVADEPGDVAMVATSSGGRRRRGAEATDAAAEIKRLQMENSEQSKVNKMFKAGGVFFAKELDRP